jgi:hypothetical protein
MNTLILILALIVGLCYFGEKYCPAVLKQNKQILLGVLIGLGSASFMGVGIEGLMVTPECCAAGTYVGDGVVRFEGDSASGCDPGIYQHPDNIVDPTNPYLSDSTKWDDQCEKLRNSAPGPAPAPPPTAKDSSGRGPFTYGRDRDGDEGK